VERVFQVGWPVGVGSRLKGWLASWGHERRQLNRARRAADAELRETESVPARLAWRSAELTAGAHRLELAHEVRALLRTASPHYLPSAAPLDRSAVRAETGALLAVADRLSDLSHPIAPRGVLLLHELLADGHSPLYLDSERQLHFAVQLVSAALVERA
jgi:hypothetical protein